MQTEFIKLAVIFIVIMVMVLAKLKLRDAMIAAILLTVILFMPLWIKNDPKANLIMFI